MEQSFGQQMLLPNVAIDISLQVWQEINEENNQVQEIMRTLESFQLETTPSKPPSNQDGINDIWPVQVERRYSMDSFHTHLYCSVYI